jgi:hypothetical protein
MSSVAPDQLFITVVHGTWPDGLFRTLLGRRRRTYWFDDGSSFFTRLSAELGDIPHRIQSLPWRGENSVYERDKAARSLAEYLSAEHAEHPHATQLIIAHSHGGNIALRAFHHLQMRGGSHCGDGGADPFVVTLATPFIEIHEADFGPRPLYVRIALTLVMWILSLILASGLLFLLLYLSLPRLSQAYFSAILLIVIAGASLAVALVGWWWIVRKATSRRHQVNALKDATRLRDLMLAHRLLVIRAIDDEASLVLALGTILNYVTARSIAYTLILYFVVSPIALYSIDSPWAPWLPNWAYVATVLLFVALNVMLLGVLMLSRSAHGCELARSPMECQINTQSVPDAANLSRIITLTSQSYTKSLRHGIYEHENCAKSISDWIRSQPGAFKGATPQGAKST